MKKYIIFFIALVITGALSAQHTEHLKGIYLTAEDFKLKKLTHASKHTHLKLHEVFKKDIIEVKLNDSTYTYEKKDVYGYRESSGEEYRIIDGKFHLIVNPSENILIYKVPKGTVQKGLTQTYAYYFSVNHSSSIMELTMRNVEKAFGNNKKFDEFVEIHFKSDSDLLEYDSEHKMYKLNRLYSLSLTN